MADDTNWLKKNPSGSFRMSLRRSSRFYVEDADSSIMPNLDKPSTSALPIPHIRRKSNIPIDQRREMTFKIPALVQNRSGIKKPINQLTKSSTIQTQLSRPSYLNTSQNRNKSVILNKSSIKRPVKPSIAAKTRPSTIRTQPSSGLKPLASERMLNLMNRSGGNVDKSIQLPRIFDHSTPMEPRSILKQQQKANNSEISLLETDKPKAAKRVNFNGNEENEGEKTDVTEDCLESEPTASENGLWCIDEDSTTNFTNSFAPISYESKENIPEDEETLTRVMNLWQSHRERLSSVRSELESIDEAFKSMLNHEIEGGIRVKFSMYDTEKKRLYEKLRNLEEEFRNEMMKGPDFREKFSDYLKSKARLAEEVVNLERSFGEKLSAMMSQEKESTLEDKLKKVSDKSKAIKRKSSGKSSDKRPGLRKQEGRLPTSSPGVRRKIENQIRTLFQE